MNPRENILALLHGEKPEAIPHVLMGFWDEHALKWLLPDHCWDERMNYLPSDEPMMNEYPDTPRTAANRQVAVNFAQHLNLCCLGVGDGGPTTFGHGGPAEIQGRVIERTADYKILQYEGGHKRRFNYHPHSVQYFDFPVRTDEDIDRLQLPDMSDPERFRDVERDASFYKAHGFMPTASIQGFFSGVHNSFMAMEDTLINLLDQPKIMKRLIQKLANMNFQAVEMVMSRGVEMIEVCDDLGDRHGLLLSPSLFAEYFQPLYRQLCGMVHDLGGWVHFHCHGNITRVMPLLVDCGFDLMNPFDQQEIADVKPLMTAFGDKIVFVGCIDSDIINWPVVQQTQHIQGVVELGQRYCKRGYVFQSPSFPAEMGRNKFERLMAIIQRALHYPARIEPKSSY